MKRLAVIFLFFIYTFNLFSNPKFPEEAIKRMEENGQFIIELGNNWYAVYIQKESMARIFLYDDIAKAAPTDWTIEYVEDAMTDKKAATMYKNPKLSTDDNEKQKMLTLSVARSITANELSDVLCVMGHNAPNEPALLRIDKNTPLETMKVAPCIIMDDAIKNQLETGKEIILRGSPFPYENVTTNPKPLVGYSEAKALMDFWYKNGKPLGYKP